MNEIENLRKKQEELKRELEELDTQIKELKEQNEIKEDYKRWRAQEGKDYWYIDSDCEIYKEFDRNDDYDNARYVIGNYYKTEEEAEKTAEKMKIYTQLKDLALRLNQGRKVDWNSSVQAKWHIYYDHNDSLITTIGNHSYQDLGQIYCLDKNFLEIAKQEIGEENLKKLFE